MITLELHDEQVFETSGKLDNGQQWHKRFQKGYVSLPGKLYPVECEVRLRADQVPHRKGKHLVLASSVEVVNGRLMMGRFLDLGPFEESKK